MKKEIILFSILFCLLLISCWNPFAPREGIVSEINPISLKDPMNILNRIVLSYQNRDIDLYSSTLDSTNFIFIFDPKDEGLEEYLEQLGITDYSWGYTEEYLSTKSIFASMEEKNIVLFPVFSGGYEQTHGDTLLVIVRSYNFEPPVIEGEIIEGTVHFWIKKCSDELWRIIRWYDYVR
ncbi:hypothetical protein KAX75_06090 [candidate division WOR-3 bacterium]|nr:hypothetical protein [candidate division WOR-3 bacterium]